MTLFLIAVIVFVIMCSCSSSKAKQKSNEYFKNKQSSKDALEEQQEEEDRLAPIVEQESKVIARQNLKHPEPLTKNTRGTHVNIHNNISYSYEQVYYTNIFILCDIHYWDTYDTLTGRKYDINEGSNLHSSKVVFDYEKIHKCFLEFEDGNFIEYLDSLDFTEESCTSFMQSSWLATCESSCF